VNNESEFADVGYLGPVRVLSKRECRRFLRTLDAEPPQPGDWIKDLAVGSRPYYDFASRPEILDVVSELLGGQVILWGGSLLDREPGAVHHWHTDIECAAPEARTVSVWIGLENTTPKSSLVVIPGSHRFGATVQEVRGRHGVGRDQATAENVLGWSREHEPRSELVPTSVHDGEAIFFDGKLWHGTHNVSRKTRARSCSSTRLPRRRSGSPTSRSSTGPSGSSRSRGRRACCCAVTRLRNRTGSCRRRSSIMASRWRAGSNRSGCR